MNGLPDRGESVDLMEPMRLSEGSHHRPELTDLAVELAQHAAGFRRSLPEGVMTALAGLVRAMNCYYSNLIEGHNTHPVDIERALRNDYSSEPDQRNLQLEAKAHIAVQAWIESGGLAGRATTAEGILEVHRRFCEQLPEELLRVEDSKIGKSAQMAPGEYRQDFVEVGRHIAISPGAIPRFMQRFEDRYGELGKSEMILAAAASHHRLLWIHPFLDGNGRVARLMSFAVLTEVLDTGGVWSIARGLARNVNAYKEHLMACDAPRHGDFDGRGVLSEEALAAFTKFFLQACLDQVRFMEKLVEPRRLRDRLRLWAEEEIRVGTLPPKAGNVLDAVLYKGELERGEVAEVVGTGDRQARRIVASLVGHGVLGSETPRSTLHIAFPAALAYRLMPGLFPEQSE